MNKDLLFDLNPYINIKECTYETNIVKQYGVNFESQSSHIISNSINLSLNLGLNCWPSILRQITNQFTTVPPYSWHLTFFTKNKFSPTTFPHSLYYYFLKMWTWIKTRHNLPLKYELNDEGYQVVIAQLLAWQFATWFKSRQGK